MRKGVFDDMRRKIILPDPIQRVVSLVPSDTETLFDLGLGGLLVGRTEYCVEPAALVSQVETVGGTKDVDVSKVIALAPDLVLANQEENSRANLEALAQAGIRVFIAFPKRVQDAYGHVARLAGFFHAEEKAKPILRKAYQLSCEKKPDEVVSVFVPIWRDPLMTFSNHTYSHDILALAGARNVFADRERKYPLKADLGERSPLPADQLARRDKRYPRITDAEIVARAPQLILLPDEPYAFGEEDRDYFLSLNIPGLKEKDIRFVDGKDLFWPGTRSADALLRCRALVESCRR